MDSSSSLMAFFASLHNSATPSSAACFNATAFSFNAWLPLLLFKQTEQPRVLKGTVASSVAQIFLVGAFLAILYLSTRDEKAAVRRAEENAASEVQKMSGSDGKEAKKWGLEA